MNLERAALLSLSLGLLAMVQPWAHAFFVIGFPLALAGVVGCVVAARRGADGEEGA